MLSLQLQLQLQLLTYCCKTLRTAGSVDGSKTIGNNDVMSRGQGRIFDVRWFQVIANVIEQNHASVNTFRNSMR